jgi:hypothetical protein
MENQSPVPSEYQLQARRARLVPLTLVLVITIPLMMYLALRYFSARNGFGELTTEVELTKPSDIEAYGQFKLPPSVSNTHGQVITWLDQRMRIRFDIKPSDLPAFLASTAIAQPLSANPADIAPHFLGGPSDAKPWWTPLQPSKFEAGSGTIVGKGDEPTVRESILIDETSPTMWTVWFIADS